MSLLFQSIALSDKKSYSPCTLCRLQCRVPRSLSRALMQVRRGILLLNLDQWNSDRQEPWILFPRTTETLQTEVLLPVQARGQSREP